jgi:hypothetical protein
MDISDDVECRQLSVLLDSFGLVQHVSGSTHIHGHTLDLLISREVDGLIQDCKVGEFASDHNVIKFSLKSGKEHAKRKSVQSRKIKSINISNLAQDIEASELSQALPDDVDDMVNCYDSVLRGLLDKHAPEKSISVAQRQAQPWMNDQILDGKRDRRRWERLWRKSGLMVHKLKYKESCENVKKLIQKAKSDYFITQIDDCGGNQKKLFQIVDKLLGRNRSTPLPQFNDARTLAQTFNDFFVSKISTIRISFAELETSTVDMACPPIDSLLSPSTSKLVHFVPTTVSEIISIVTKSSKASCSLDPIPTKLLCDLLPLLAPTLVNLVNASLSSGNFPSQLKSAIVLPLLKKPSLDTEILKNYRPVSNLSFISKLIEKVVASRILDHMKDNNLLDEMQSAYRSGHSTETALLRVHNDIVISIDEGRGVALILLDLSAAFDTVDHKILLDFLRDYVGLDGPVLKLFQTYLASRTQCVSIKGVLSELSELAYGVPQGSVLGPIEFCIYTIPLGAILRHYNIQYHIYADDTQLYCSFDLTSPLETISKISACISDIRTWMIRNKLKINDDKTEFLLITSPRAKLTENIELRIGQANIIPSDSCKSLGVMLDSQFSMDSQIRHLCRSMHYHLRNIGAIRNILTVSATEQLVHALVTSRLDYCNSLLYGVPDYQINCLQRLQNIAARIVTRCDRRDHITPVLKSLHWLPVKYRIDFKILLLVYKCLNSLAPSYLCELIKPYHQDHYSTRRNQQNCLQKPPLFNLKSYGEKSFTYAAPTEWNKLPLEVKSAPSVENFKSSLKTYLFKKHFK